MAGQSGKVGAGSRLLAGVQIVAPVRAAVARFQPPQQAGEAVQFEEGGQGFARHAVQRKVLQRLRQVAIFLQCHQHAAQFRIFALFEQALLQLGFLHVGSSIERGGQTAIVLDQLGRGLRADSENAGNVVYRIAHQREHIADQLGGDAELFLDLFDADTRAFHGVEHIDLGPIACPDQLHQILVAADDGGVPALGLRGAGIAGDQVVRLQPLFLDTGEAEGAGGVANQRELRHQVFGRIGAVGLVFGVYLVAERMARLVEDDRKMRRAIGGVEIVRQLPKHGGVAINRADRRAFRIRQGRQAVIGAEDIGRTVDEVEVWRCCHPVGIAAGRVGVSRYRELPEV